MNTVYENTLIIIFCITTFSSFAQKEIKIDDAKNHIGDSVKICTKIYGGKYLESTKGTTTFLNAGGYYPNALLTIVIWADARKEFNNSPEEFYKGKEVCIPWKIELYKDKPQIVVTSKSQIVEQIIDKVDDKEPK